MIKQLTTLLASLCPLWALAQEDKILAPPPPPQSIPHHDTLKDFERDLKRKREAAENKNPEKVAPAPSKLEVLQKKNKSLSRLKLHNQAGFFIPYVHTFGNFRKNYIVEPGLSYKIESKLSESDLKPDASYWLGLRIQAFSGSGTYNNVNARMSFLYFGPSFSYLWPLGNNSDSVEESSNDTLSQKPSPKDKLYKNAVIFSSGIALMNRYTRTDSGDSQDGELEPVDLALDSSGVWFEAIYAQIFASTISINYTAGIQTGESKLFLSLSMGMGLWI